MSKHRLLGYNQRLPDAWVEPIQEFISTYVSPNFKLTLASATSVQVTAAADNDQVAIGISGKWRYNVATVNRSHPGGAAAIYDVWVVTTDNSYTGTTPETDNTVYTFDLRIVAHSATPVTGAGATFWGRKIGELTWDGAAITSIKQTTGGSGSGGGYGAGIILDFEGPEANIPPDTCVADGRYLDNVTEAEHFARVGNTWNTFGGLPAPPAGKHRVADLRGRGTVGKGDMGTGGATTPTATGARIQRAGITTLGTLMGVEYHPLVLAEIPLHGHGGTTGTEGSHTHTGTTGAGSAHSHAATGLTFVGTSGTTGTGSAHSHGVGSFTLPSHKHRINDAGESLLYRVPNGIGPSSGNDTNWSNAALTSTALTDVPEGTLPLITGTSATEAAHTHSFTPVGTLSGTTATESAHTHGFTTGAGSSHQHSITAEGGGGSHENVHPVAVVNKVVTLR